MIKAGRFQKAVQTLVKRAVVVKVLISLIVVVFATSISVTSSTYQAEIGSAVSVTSGLLATDRGFSVSPTAGSPAGTSCSSPIVFGALPQTANTTITAGHWVYDVRVNSTTNAPASSKFSVTLVLASNTYGPLCIQTLATVSNDQIIDCLFDVGATLPVSPYAFDVTIQ